MGLGMIYLSRLRSTLAKRTVVLTFAVLGIIMVMIPDLTNTLASLVGVGRGADLLLYLGIVGLMFLFLLVYVRMRILETALTDLVRSIAVANAHNLALLDPDQRSPEMASSYDVKPQ